MLEHSRLWQADGEGIWTNIGTEVETLEMPQNGYIAVYLSNESVGEVYYDNLTVTVQPGALLEEKHYYPYGLPIQGWGTAASGSLSNRQRYQSNEYREELSLNWMDFHNRQYDPQLGRFLSIDPLSDADGQHVLSPYHAMACNPSNVVDPLGLKGEYLIMDREIMTTRPSPPGYMVEGVFVTLGDALARMMGSSNSSDGIKASMDAGYAAKTDFENRKQFFALILSVLGVESANIWGAAHGIGPVSGSSVTTESTSTGGERGTAEGGKEQSNDGGQNGSSNDRPYQVIVVNDPDGAAKAGHSAVLIGNTEDGYTYISKMEEVHLEAKENLNMIMSLVNTKVQKSFINQRKARGIKTHTHIPLRMQQPKQ